MKRNEVKKQTTDTETSFNKFTMTTGFIKYPASRHKRGNCEYNKHSLLHDELKIQQ